MGIDSASVGRKVRETCAEQKMVEELRKRLGESLKVKTGNCEEIRLTYFPARGRAEISRLILKHAGVKFDDIRLTGEDFAKVKPILPYGSMPVLEYKGEEICESMAIAAFLADICNLAGTNAVEKAKANEIVLAMNGLFETIAKILFSPEGEKAGMKKKWRPWWWMWWDWWVQWWYLRPTEFSGKAVAWLGEGIPGELSSFARLPC